jgi:hypothetical protein
MEYGNGWGCTEYSVISALVFFILFLCGYLTTLFYVSGLYYVIFYATYFVLLIGFILVLSGYVYESSETHFHHWFISLLILTFLSHHNPIISAIHGIFFGVFIEGSARFGLDPVWNEIDLPERLTDIR